MPVLQQLEEEIMRILTTFVVFAIFAIIFHSADAVDNKFNLKWTKADQAGVTLFIDSDLPDNASVMVSVTRVYTATSDGKQDRYSGEYFSEEGTLSQWREPRRITIDSELWVADLIKHQASMARLGPTMAFDIDEIDNYLDVDANVYANKTGPRFGPGRLGNIEHIAKSEIRIPHNLLTTVPIPKRSMIVSWDKLELRHTYRLLGKETPLMPALHATSLDDLGSVRYLPSGTVIKVGSITRQSGYFWYQVTLVENPGVTGWINSSALRQDGAYRISN